MPPFPVPNVNQTSDFLAIAQFVNNDASGGIMMPVILLTIWIIVFVGSIAENRQASRAWIFASFICSVLGIILGVLNMLDKTYIFLLILMVAFGLFWIKLANARQD